MYLRTEGVTSAKNLALLFVKMLARYFVVNCFLVINERFGGDFKRKRRTVESIEEWNNRNNLTLFIYCKKSEVLRFKMID